jgi:hypothetical protein
MSKTTSISRLSSLIRQCGLERWEEDYDVTEKLEIAAGGWVSYVRFLCVGQSVNLRAQATVELDMGISIETPGGSRVPLVKLFHPSDLPWSELNCQVPKTGHYLLTVVNDSVRLGKVTVYIKAPARRLGIRPKIGTAHFLKVQESFHRVVPTTVPKRRSLKEQPGDMTMLGKERK